MDFSGFLLQIPMVDTHMEVSINGGTPRHHPFIDGIFSYKTIQLLGYPHLWEPPTFTIETFCPAC